MRDYVSIGSVPLAESCSQVGDPNYKIQSKIECKRFIEQLKRQFGEPPIGAHLEIKEFIHEFGNYHEVVCYYNDEYEVAENYCFEIESNTPEYWED
jgi:hypothetical protein